ncbi:serine/arginine-rich splicing factor 7 [Eupeodes corollae]|uniref:serine/arginine-rich splicing factor 7 n=1 Tax=Eupeodes corollae TaxID=290404 RepID=UPI0024932374|nr:serine/arginine-rich splicing factor 7 [Eupeodes corollae]
MSKRMSRYPSDRKVYVGDLGNNARKNELEYAFSTYGTLRSVWIARNPPGFAFVEFEDARDAADAVRGLDGRTVCGRRARVELSTGRYAGGRNDRKGSKSGGRPFHPDDKCYECGGRGHYARDCRRYGRRRRSRSKSRSRSYSRDQRTRSHTGSRSHSRSKSKSRSPKKDYRDERKPRSSRRSTENDHENGVRHNDDGRNGVARSPKRRYDSSCSPKRGHSRNRADSIDSKRSSSNSRRSHGARTKSRSPISKNHKD